jgi:DNA-binding NtrC family response regulator
MMEGLRILLVDDEPSLLRLLQRHLQRGGHQVLAADSAEAALEQLQEGQRGPDVLITDEVLPGMAGTELAKALLHRHPESACLLCSGYPISLDGFTAAERERVTILQKPYLPEELDAAVSRTADTGRQRRAAGSHGV